MNAVTPGSGSPSGPSSPSASRQTSLFLFALNLPPNIEKKLSSSNLSRLSCSPLRSASQSQSSSKESTGSAKEPADLMATNQKIVDLTAKRKERDSSLRQSMLPQAFCYAGTAPCFSAVAACTERAPEKPTAFSSLTSSTSTLEHLKDSSELPASFKTASGSFSALHSSLRSSIPDVEPLRSPLSWEEDTCSLLQASKDPSALCLPSELNSKEPTRNICLKRPLDLGAFETSLYDFLSRKTHSFPQKEELVLLDENIDELNHLLQIKQESTVWFFKEVVLHLRSLLSNMPLTKEEFATIFHQALFDIHQKIENEPVLKKTMKTCFSFEYLLRHFNLHLENADLLEKKCQANAQNVETRQKNAKIELAKLNGLPSKSRKKIEELQKQIAALAHQLETLNAKDLESTKLFTPFNISLWHAAYLLKNGKAFTINGQTNAFSSFSLPDPLPTQPSSTEEQPKKPQSKSEDIHLEDRNYLASLPSSIKQLFPFHQKEPGLSNPYLGPVAAPKYLHQKYLRYLVFLVSDPSIFGPDEMQTIYQMYQGFSLVALV